MSDLGMKIDPATGKKIYTYGFPMAGNTATMVLYRRTRSWRSLWCFAEIEVLLGLRTEDSDAYPNYWSLPGGYLNAGTEHMVNVAVRETKEETMLEICENRWKFFFLDDKPGADPRYVQVINVCYSAEVTRDEYNAVAADDDLQEVEWVSLRKAKKRDLAFTHNNILREFARAQ